jgi:hypothetical protein
VGVFADDDADADPDDDDNDDVDVDDVLNGGARTNEKEAESCFFTSTPTTLSSSTSLSSLFIDTNDADKDEGTDIDDAVDGGDCKSGDISGVRTACSVGIGDEHGARFAGGDADSSGDGDDARTLTLPLSLPLPMPMTLPLTLTLTGPSVFAFVL